MHKPKYSLRKIAYFVATAEEGTITGAAKRLNISQSALTDSISALEYETGVKLFQRRKARGTQLTTAGKQVLKTARDLLRVSEELEATFDAIEHRIQGELNIGCYPPLLPLLVPKLIVEMEKAHPELTLNFVEGTQDTLQDMLFTGQVDVALAYQVNISENLVCKPLISLNPYILLAPEHRLAEREKVFLRDLCDDDMIMLDLAPSIVNTESFFHQYGLEPKVRHRTSSLELLRSLVARNLGYAILLRKSETNVSHEGLPFLVKTIGEELSPNQVSLIHERYQTIPKKIAALEQVSRELFKIKP